MTKEEKIMVCRGQFCYEKFFEDYHLQLKKLHNDGYFMEKIRSVSGNTSDSLLFGVGIFEDVAKAGRFKDFKDSFCNIFFDSLRFSEYPEYREIYYDTRDKGYSGKSATISVFYAMLYLDLVEDIVVSPHVQYGTSIGELYKSIGIGKSNASFSAVTEKRSHSNSTLRSGFEGYLIKKGYKQYTPSGQPSTVYAYIKGIDDVCDAEHLDWSDLANHIGRIVLRYDLGGDRESIGNKGHRTVFNALLRYREFLNQE